MATSINPKTGLLQTDQDQLTAAAGSNVTGSNSNAVANPLAGVTPNLSPSNIGTTQQNYGQAIADAGKQFNFNPKYAAMDQALQRAIANAAFDRTNTIQSLDANYQNQSSEAQRQNQLAMKSLGAKMSTQGLGWSGINLEEQGNLNDAFNRYVGSLGQQYSGGRAAAENQYGRTLGDIASQREGLYAQQSEEEYQQRLQAAQQAAEAKARQDAANRQEQLLQAQIYNQQQNAIAMQNYMAQLAAQQAAMMPHSNGIGGGGGVNLGAWGIGAGDTSNDINNQINLLPMDMLTSLYTVPQLPDDIRTAVRKRIVDMNTPGSPNYYQTPVGHRDQPYGFNQGGIAL